VDTVNVRSTSPFGVLIDEGLNDSEELLLFLAGHRLLS
jgi:hypothetical protein